MIAGPSQAQFGLADPSPGRDSSIARVISTFAIGQPIRFALLRSRWAGSYLGRNADTLFLGQRRQPPMVVKFNAIDTVWRASSGTRRGIWIGAVTGGLVGPLIARAASDEAVESRRTLARGFAVGAASGAVAGALVGRLFRQWNRVYP